MAVAGVGEGVEEGVGVVFTGDCSRCKSNGFSSSLEPNDSDGDGSLTGDLCTTFVGLLGTDVNNFGLRSRVVEFVMLVLSLRKRIEVE